MPQHARCTRDKQWPQNRTNATFAQRGGAVAFELTVRLLRVGARREGPHLM